MGQDARGADAIESRIMGEKEYLCRIIDSDRMWTFSLSLFFSQSRRLSRLMTTEIRFFEL